VLRVHIAGARPIERSPEAGGWALDVRLLGGMGRTCRRGRPCAQLGNIPQFVLARLPIEADRLFNCNICCNCPAQPTVRSTAEYSAVAVEADRLLRWGIFPTCPSGRRDRLVVDPTSAAMVRLDFSERSTYHLLMFSSRAAKLSPPPADPWAFSARLGQKFLRVGQSGICRRGRPCALNCVLPRSCVPRLKCGLREPHFR
jgi:hypothetical protein